MTPQQAQGRVMLAVATAGGLTAIAVIVRGKAPRLRILIGAGFVGVVLLAAADSAPELVGKFASLILVTSVFTAGAVAIGPLTRLVSEDPTP